MKYRKHLSTLRRAGRLAMALLLLLVQFPTQPVCAAAGTATAAESTDTADPVSDSLIEWTELEELVKTKNPIYLIYVNSSKTTTDILSSSKQVFDEEMQEQLDEIEESIDRIGEQKEELKDLPGGTVIDEKGTTVKELRETLDAAANSLKATRITVRQGMGKFQGTLRKTQNEIEEELKPAREQLTKAAEELYITYNQLRISRDSLVQQEEMYRGILELQKKAVEQNLTAEDSTIDLELTLNTLANGRLEVEKAMQEVYSILILQLGFEPGSNVEIGKLPAAERTLLEQADPEKDYQTMLDNNQEIKDLDELENYTGSAALSIRDLTVSKAKADAGISLNSLYYEMRVAAGKLDASETAVKTAKKEYEKAQQLNSLGLLSEINRDLAKIQYLTEAAEYEKTEAELFAAVNAYQWALRGQLN